MQKPMKTLLRTALYLSAMAYMKTAHGAIDTASCRRDYELPEGNYVPKGKCERPECKYSPPWACASKGHISRELVRHSLDSTTREQFEKICSVLRRTEGCGHKLGWLDDECPEITFVLKTENGYARVSCSVDTCHKCCGTRLLKDVAEELGYKLRHTSVYSLVHLREELEQNELGVEMGQCACSDFRKVFGVDTWQPEQQQACRVDTAQSDK